MVHHNDLAVAVSQDELIERVAGIVVGTAPHDRIVGLLETHIALMNNNGHIGLMIFTVRTCVHLVACTNIQITIQLGTAHGTSIEGNCGVGAVQAVAALPLPILTVFDNADNLSAVALAGILLAEDEEVGSRPGKESAPDWQF